MKNIDSKANKTILPEWYQIQSLSLPLAQHSQTTPSPSSSFAYHLPCWPLPNDDNDTNVLCIIVLLQWALYTTSQIYLKYVSKIHYSPSSWIKTYMLPNANACPPVINFLFFIRPALHAVQLRLCPPASKERLLDNNPLLWGTIWVSSYRTQCFLLWYFALRFTLSAHRHSQTLHTVQQCVSLKGICLAMTTHWLLAHMHSTSHIPFRVQNGVVFIITKPPNILYSTVHELHSALLHTSSSIECCPITFPACVFIHIESNQFDMYITAHRFNNNNVSIHSFSYAVWATTLSARAHCALRTLCFKKIFVKFWSLFHEQKVCFPLLLTSTRFSTTPPSALNTYNSLPPYWIKSYLLKSPFLTPSPWN